jgi:hypothetical protein
MNKKKCSKIEGYSIKYIHILCLINPVNGVVIRQFDGWGHIGSIDIIPM